ncbi:hypothetical protein Ciccas_013446, partial [Cichlidogyrus casuarinus]
MNLIFFMIMTSVFTMGDGYIDCTQEDVDLRDCFSKADKNGRTVDFKYRAFWNMEMYMSIVTKNLERFTVDSPEYQSLVLSIKFQSPPNWPIMLSIGNSSQVKFPMEGTPYVVIASNTTAQFDWRLRLLALETGSTWLDLNLNVGTKGPSNEKDYSIKCCAYDNEFLQNLNPNYPNHTFEPIASVKITMSPSDTPIHSVLHTVMLGI